MMQSTEIEPDVHHIKLDGDDLYLIATAHISHKSAELAERYIREIKPDCVCIELDEQRYQSLLNPNRWRETDLVEIIRKGKVYVLMAQLALAGFQKKLGNKLQIKPGEEMIRAAKAAEDIGASINCVDRDVKITLKRSWAKAGLWTMLKIVGAMIASLFKSEELDEEQIEKLKEGDALELMVQEFSNYLPTVKTSLLDERDLYMAKKITDNRRKTTVAVVGAAHARGIIEHLGEDIDIEELEKLPPPKLSVKLISWGIPLIIISMIVWGFTNISVETGNQMLLAWVLANGCFAALGAIIALSHPLTIITAFVAAPITSLNPTIAAGWVCGLVEAMLKKPRVMDFETIADDISTVRGVWSNRLSKVLLVVAFANIGSSIGTFIGAGKIASLLT